MSRRVLVALTACLGCSSGRDGGGSADSFAADVSSHDGAATTDDAAAPSDVPGPGAVDSATGGDDSSSPLDAVEIDANEGGPDTSDVIDSDASAVLVDDAVVDPDAFTEADTSGSSDAGADSVDSDSVDAAQPDDVGPPLPAPLFDLALIRDTTATQCTFSNHRTAFDDGVALDVWDVTYQSLESLDGVLHPILIRGFAAKPTLASGVIPGLVQAHGLGGFSKPEHATGLSALTGAFVLAYTGPGGGTEPSNTSEGLGASAEGGYRLFDTLTDPRESWFWGHAVAGLRAFNCLETRPEVDASRFGMTGFSAGGVVTLIDAAVDDRIDAAVPLSGTGGWALSVLSPTAWQQPLLALAGLTTSSPEWTTLLAAIDSTNLLPATHASIFMVNGTSDEFFPLTAHVATYDAINPAVFKRTSFAANFDHGCYAISGVENASTIEARADLRARGAQRALFHHVFGTKSVYATLPEAPSGLVNPVGAATVVTATVDPGSGGLSVDNVKIWWSNDDGFLWGSVELDPQGGNLWGTIAGFPTVANTQWYIDAQYTTGGLFPEKFSVSSRPTIPAGLVPHIRSKDNCL